MVFIEIILQEHAPEEGDGFAYDFFVGDALQIQLGLDAFFIEVSASFYRNQANFAISLHKQINSARRIRDAIFA